ncbi:MAG TPA: hypothetical protein VHR16_01800 [Candidatus Limnocylindrales bacterium]|nr:hypothetical protein [Candidatus Limnocylindrales bacterium]
MFGLFDRDGWAWAFTKAAAWLLVIIMALGYIPDRAYYFIVSRTIELGILGWSPINLCPPENGAGVPCPVPAGGIVPWQPSPQGVALPQARTQAAGAQLGKNLLLIGGSDGSAATTTTYVAQVDAGSFGAWADGPALPEARSDAAITTLNGTAYLVGGDAPDGKATNTVWTIGLDPDTSELGTWKPVQLADKSDLTLPEARSGAAIVAVSDGIIVAGGRGPDGKPSASVWKSTLDKNGVLGTFAEQPSLAYPVADAELALEGTFLWLFGGADANGPVGGVQRADYGVASTATGSSAPGAPSAAAGTTAPAGATAPATPLASAAAAATSAAATTAPASPGASAAPTEAPSSAPAASAAASAPPAATSAPAPAASAAPGASASASGATDMITKWTTDNSFNLPGPRTGAGGFAANGAIYLVGGSDGSTPKRELYWALPDAGGNLPGGWHHLDQTDLPDGLANPAVVVSGSTVFLLGGEAAGGPVASSMRASLAPQEPFLRLGLVGAVVPGLQIGGEIGQQLGYLAAAGVGTGNFAILIAIGWLFNHREMVRGWWDRRRMQREARPPRES